MKLASCSWKHFLSYSLSEATWGQRKSSRYSAEHPDGGLCKRLRGVRRGLGKLSVRSYSGRAQGPASAQPQPSSVLGYRHPEQSWLHTWTTLHPAYLPSQGPSSARLDVQGNLCASSLLFRPFKMLIVDKDPSSSPNPSSWKRHYENLSSEASLASFTSVLPCQFMLTLSPTLRPSCGRPVAPCKAVGHPEPAWVSCLFLHRCPFLVFSVKALDSWSCR